MRGEYRNQTPLVKRDRKTSTSPRPTWEASERGCHGLAMARVVLALVAACAGPSRPAPKPAPIDEPTDCTCAQLSAPVAEPSTHERVRWERTATEVDAVITEVARVYVLPCPATIDGDLARIFAVHARALADHAALDASSCDAFSRWAALRSDGNREIAITEVMRSGKCELSKQASDQLNALLIIRGCTTVSSR